MHKINLAPNLNLCKNTASIKGGRSALQKYMQVGSGKESTQGMLVSIYFKNFAISTNINGLRDA